MRMTRVSLFAAAFLLASAAHAQTVDVFKSPKTPCCLPGALHRLADQLEDWNELGQFYAANEDLKKQPADPKRVVFMGDSITIGWHLDESFPGKPYVNRGIGTIGLPFRFNCPPEITLFTMRTGQPPQSA